jgi:hypothetical protein
VANFATSSYAVTTGAVTSALLKNVADGTYYYRIAAIHPTTVNNASLSNFTVSATSVTVAKTVAAPAWVGAAAYANSTPNRGLIKVSFAASTTPSTFADPALYYPEGSVNLVTYDVIVTNTDGNPLHVYTTTGITGTTSTISVDIGIFDPATGLTSTLPNGTYTIQVVANKGSWKPSAPKAAAAPVTVNAVLAAPAWVNAYGNNTTKNIKVLWPTVTGGQVAVVQTSGPALTIPPVVVSGSTSYVLIPGATTGTYNFTVQNTPLLGSTFTPSAAVASPAVPIL